MEININEENKKNKEYRYTLLEKYINDYKTNIDNDEKILLKIESNRFYNSLLYCITDRRIIEICHLYYTDFESWNAKSLEYKNIGEIFIKNNFLWSKASIFFIPINKKYEKIQFLKIDKAAKKEAIKILKKQNCLKKIIKAKIKSFIKTFITVCLILFIIFLIGMLMPY